jgi:hypothetical protein
MKNSNVTSAYVSQNAQAGTLRWVWAEVDYQLDVCRVTKIGHMGYLSGMQNKLVELVFLAACRMLLYFVPFKRTNFL